MKKIAVVLLIALLAGLFIPNTIIADGPPVKKSKNGISHPKGGKYYSRTRNYTPYQTMEACIKSGGRRAKR